MAKREYLMLAKPFAGHATKGWLWSEKLDGMRAFWDGGLSTGLRLDACGWGNRSMMHRYAAMPTCTGLWSRYGNPIQAPSWWLEKLPHGVLLDGELYIGHGMFEQTVSITKAFDSGQWHRINYRVFDTPPVDTMFQAGVVRTNGGGQFAIMIDVLPAVRGKVSLLSAMMPFGERLKFLQHTVPGMLHVHLPVVDVERHLDTIISVGGEGIMLKQADSIYVTNRSGAMLKHKPFHDAEGTVTGYVAGRETDKGSKLLGMMGALVLRLASGDRLELSGFTEAERELSDAANRWAREHPGDELPPTLASEVFPRGSRVTFRYREFSADGIPKEARYWRKHEIG